MYIAYAQSFFFLIIDCVVFHDGPETCHFSQFSYVVKLKACSYDPGTTHCPGATH